MKKTELKIIELYNGGESLQKLASQFECNDKTIRNLLQRHGAYVRRQGSPLKFGKITLSGYIYIRMKKDDKFYSMRNSSGYVAQHRYVMAKHLDRLLDKHETVHHIDGDRANNDISNLQIMSGNHGKGVVHVCLKCGSTDIKSIELLHN